MSLKWASWIALLISVNAMSQDQSDSATGTWKILGYAESYYSFSPNKPTDLKISDFHYSYNRLNDLNINQGFLGIEHQGKSVRLNVALHAGSYVNDNYAAEPKMARRLFNAYMGFKMNKQKDSWLDVGVFPSLIGFESSDAFSTLTLTRSLLAENSPYFMTGLRYNQPLNKKNEISFFVLTGWQRIVPLAGNSLPAIGWQWVHRTTEGNSLNWSFFIGSEYPDSSRRMRYFNNIFWKGAYKKWSYVVGVDVGIEQKTRSSKTFSSWYTPIAIVQYSISEKWRSAFRIERYADPDRVISRPANGSSVACNSQSVNVDFLPTKKIICRAEWRALQAKDPVFYTKQTVSNKSRYLTLSVAYRFAHNLQK